MKSPLLDVLLEFDPGQGISRAIIAGMTAYDDGRIGKFRCPAGVAHAVYDQHALFRRSIYHFAARTHAEGSHSLSCFFIMMIQGISGSADAGEVLVFVPI